jgi:hypothetical protein
MKRFVLIALTSASALSGCVAVGQYVPVYTSSLDGPVDPVYPPANPADYAPYLTQGTGSISGQAFLTTRGGEVRVGAGRPVTLDPLTPLARAWLRATGFTTDRFSEAPKDPLFEKARRTAVNDAQGNYRFSNLPAGQYVLRTIVNWTTGMSEQGGLIADTVALKDGEQKTLMLQNVVGRPPTSERQLPHVITREQLGNRQYVAIGTIASGAHYYSTEQALQGLRDAASLAGAVALIDAQCRAHTDQLLSVTKYDCKAVGIKWR